jgi:alginate O-acetyltransferase complex protein AlgJ
MKKFLFKAFLFFLPFLLVMALELFVLPIDNFTHRAWEALLVRKMKGILEGPFYPNMSVRKVEQGDIAPYSAFSVKREVEWQTDRHGYRKRNTTEKRYKIVIIGDSMLAGIGLTQKELLSEVLEERLGVTVYPYAPRRVSTFLKDSRFLRYPPDLVIFETSEHQIALLTPLSPRQKRVKEEGSVIEFFRKTREVSWVQSLGIFLDRIYKNNMLHYFRAQLRRKVSAAKPRYNYRAGSMLFLMGAAANKDVPKKQVDIHAQTIEGYCQAMQERGINFIFLPIPNKENIYHDLLPDPKRPVYLDQLMSGVKKRGIATIDLQKAYEKEYHKNSTLLYWLDDTHWNAKGVQIAADLIEQMVKKEERFLLH